MSVEEDSRLPVIGPKLNASWSGRGRGRKDQVQIWSAVALQEHFARGAFCDGGLPTLEELPPPLPKGRLTLAQKMGLVPLPPPVPTEEEWAKIEQVVARRNFALPVGENVCCICQEAFYATMEQGQVLLSCSHVFHEHCFHYFEKFVRRLCDRGDATSLRCPVCRNRHYHKRVFYLGKVMAQRAAIVKIQAFFRRVLARKAYMRLRLESDSKLCGGYVLERLERLSDAYTAYTVQREQERTRVLSSVDLRMQQALAACTTAAEWGALRERVASTAAKEGGLECPICLCAIEQNPHGDGCSMQNATTGEDVVAAFRREYEARKAKERLQERRKSEHARSAQKQPKKVKLNVQQASCAPTATSTSAQQAFSSNISNFVCKKSLRDGDLVQAAQKKGLRYGFLLSCGHCFHKTCLSSFEHYTEIMALEGNNAPLIPSCPLCRKAYVKVDY